MSLFDFGTFIDELRGHDTKHAEVEAYERTYGSQADKDICETAFYTDYLSKFHIDFRLETPQELGDDFDWDLLMRLVAGSFSSAYTLHLSREWMRHPTDTITAELHIMVNTNTPDTKSGVSSVTKTLDELWSFQVLRLYEIYCEEQMNLASLMTDECGSNSVNREREDRLKLFKERVSQLNKEARLYLLLNGMKLKETTPQGNQPPAYESE